MGKLLCKVCKVTYSRAGDTCFRCKDRGKVPEGSDPLCMVCRQRRTVSGTCYKCKVALKQLPRRIRVGICSRCNKEKELRATEDICLYCASARAKGRSFQGSLEHRARLAEKCSKAKHGSWKGGTVVTKDGYRLVRLSDEDPIEREMLKNNGRNGYALEHRVVMAKWLGRVLERKEIVHHRNGDKLDNSIENLRLFSSPSEHFRAVHCPSCPHCGKSLK